MRIAFLNLYSGVNNRGAENFAPIVEKEIRLDYSHERFLAGNNMQINCPFSWVKNNDYRAFRARMG